MVDWSCAWICDCNEVITWFIVPWSAISIYFCRTSVTCFAILEGSTTPSNLSIISCCVAGLFKYSTTFLTIISGSVTPAWICSFINSVKRVVYKSSITATGTFTISDNSLFNPTISISGNFIVLTSKLKSGTFTFSFEVLILMALRIAFSSIENKSARLNPELALSLFSATKLLPVNTLIVGLSNWSCTISIAVELVTKCSVNSGV